MLWKKFKSETDNAKSEIRFMRILLVSALLVIGLQSVAITRSVGKEKTILTPPEIRRSMWVEDGKASKEYLEEMAYWYASLALNITPLTSDYQTGLFLKHSAPADYGRLQADMGAKAEFIKKHNASTQFTVRSVIVDDQNTRVALQGTLNTWASNVKAGERSVTYLVAFKFINGRLHVSEFKETSDQQPFGTGAAASS